MRSLLLGAVGVGVVGGMVLVGVLLGLPSPFATGAMVGLGVMVVGCVGYRLWKGRAFRGRRGLGADLVHVGLVAVLAGGVVWGVGERGGVVWVGEGEGFAVEGEVVTVEEVGEAEGGEVRLRVGGREEWVGPNRPVRVGVWWVFLGDTKEERLVLRVRDGYHVLYPGQGATVGGVQVWFEGEGRVRIGEEGRVVRAGERLGGVEVVRVQEGRFVGLVVRRVKGVWVVMGGLAAMGAGVVLLGIPGRRRT
ncbi:hypothetical protein [Spirochaeta thermophila]|uniref:hypothetical protein n=1 Tax=Winmispira thermophila TaxID=154 RepID=UPI0013050A26|nr:hypothetical protein [Spirochaeta thermophila]